MDVVHDIMEGLRALPHDVDAYWQSGRPYRATCMRKIISLPENLNDIFRYDDGQLYWKVCSGRVHAGERAGYLKEGGVVAIRYRGVLLLAHRVIWQMFNGLIPHGMQIDHIDHNPSNNRIENLRLVTHAENQRNLKLARHNSSGVTNVCWYSRKKRWVVYFKVAGELKWIGTFRDFSAAVAARNDALERLGFHQNHGKRLVQLEVGSSQQIGGQHADVH